MQLEDLFPKHPMQCTLHRRIVCQRCDQLVDAGLMVVWSTIDKRFGASHHPQCPSPTTER